MAQQGPCQAAPDCTQEQGERRVNTAIRQRGAEAVQKQSHGRTQAQDFKPGGRVSGRCCGRSAGEEKVDQAIHQGGGKQQQGQAP